MFFANSLLLNYAKSRVVNLSCKYGDICCSLKMRRKKKRSSKLWPVTMIQAVI